VGAAVTDALEAIAGPEVIDEVFGRDLLEVLPLTHIRGRNLTDSFVIIDEAQNLERAVLLTALSRLGQGSRVVLTHDVAQRAGGSPRRGGVGDRDAQGSPAVRPRLAERSPVAALVTQVLDGAPVR
jgi:PhoH-like ATPase